MKHFHAWFDWLRCILIIKVCQQHWFSLFPLTCHPYWQLLMVTPWDSIQHLLRADECIAVLRNYTIVFRHTNELRDFALTTHKRKFLFAALNIWFVLGAARLVVVRLVGCLRWNGLAGCWDGSVLLDVWGKYSGSPCSFVCLVIGESRRYLH